MPFYPKNPLKLRNPGCPYCYDGIVCWDKDAKRFFCSICKTIIIIDGWD